MNNQRNNIMLAVLISVLIHSVIAGLGLIYLGRITPPSPDETIIEIDLNQTEWKIADIMKPEVEKVPKEAKHLGMYDSSVKDETVAENAPRAPGRPESRGGGDIEKLKKETEEFFRSERLLERKVFQKKVDSEPDIFSPKRMPEDFYPDYKRGSHTYINVQKHPEVAYFVRLKRVFKLTWDPSPVLMRGRMRGEISRGSIKVVLGLAINSSGEISELFVFNSSGVGGYDSEAMRAVRVSAPFSKPPKKFLSDDGILRVSWTFVVYL